MSSTGLLVPLAATFAYCVGSAVVPVLNAETYLLALGATVVVDTGGSQLWWLALTAASGQMVGKSFLYATGRRARAYRWRWLRKQVAEGQASDRFARCQHWLGRHLWAPAALTFVSAASGVPPFALWSVMAGSLHTTWWVFLSCGLTGRFLRFAALLAAPALAQQLLH